MKLFLLIGACMTLNACAPINTQFSCNDMAGDQCLSIEQVNAMTEVQNESGETSCGSNSKTKPVIYYPA